MTRKRSERKKEKSLKQVKENVREYSEKVKKETKKSRKIEKTEESEIDESDRANTEGELIAEDFEEAHESWLSYQGERVKPVLDREGQKIQNCLLLLRESFKRQFLDNLVLEQENNKLRIDLMENERKANEESKYGIIDAETKKILMENQESKVLL